MYFGTVELRWNVQKVQLKNSFESNSLKKLDSVTNFLARQDACETTSRLWRGHEQGPEVRVLPAPARHPPGLPPPRLRRTSPRSHRDVTPKK